MSYTPEFTWVPDWNAPTDLEERVLISQGDTGIEQRREKWDRPLGTFQLVFSLLKTADYNGINAFYRARHGAANHFYWLHPAEKDVAGEEIGPGDGAETVFYLDHKYVTSGSDSITVNGVAQVRGVDYNIDLNLGKITFTAPPGAYSILATYEFSYKVRFADKITWVDLAPGVWEARVVLKEVF